MLMCLSPILESKGKYNGINCAMFVAYLYHALAVRLKIVAALAKFNARLFQDSNTLLFFPQAKYPRLFPPPPIHYHPLEKKPIISRPLELVQEYKVRSSSLNCYLFFCNFYYFCMFLLKEQYTVSQILPLRVCTDPCKLIFFIILTYLIPIALIQMIW